MELILYETNKKLYLNEKEIGKVLIEKDYPFALIKFREVNFSENIDFNTKDASIKIEKPNWIKN
mgnify:CR=1 FL=1